MYRNLIHNETRRFDCTECRSCCCCHLLLTWIEGSPSRDEQVSFNVNRHGFSSSSPRQWLSRTGSTHLRPNVQSPMMSRQQRPLVSLIDLKNHDDVSPPPPPRSASRGNAISSNSTIILAPSVTNTPAGKRSHVDRCSDIKPSSSTCNMMYDTSNSSLRRVNSSAHNFTDVISDENNPVDETYTPDSDTCIPDATHQHKQQQQQQHTMHIKSSKSHKHYICRSSAMVTRSTSPDSLCEEGESSVNCSPSHMRSNRTGIKSRLASASSSSSSHLHLSSHRLPHPLPDPVAATNSTLMHQSHSNQNIVQLQLHTHKF